MAQLFVLEKRPVTPATAFESSFFETEPVQRGSAPVCETCGRFTGSLQWLPPYRAEIETWGKAFGDLVFGPGSSILVSERFVLIWREAGLIGLSGFDAVEVTKVVRHRRFKDVCPNYSRVEVTRSRAAIDDKASGLVRDGGPVCPDCRLSGIIHGSRRIALKASPAPKEDIFFARGLPGTVLASERFHTVCVEHDIRNAILVPADRYRFGMLPSDSETMH